MWPFIFLKEKQKDNLIDISNFNDFACILNELFEGFEDQFPHCLCHSTILEENSKNFCCCFVVYAVPYKETEDLFKSARHLVKKRKGLAISKK